MSTKKEHFNARVAKNRGVEWVNRLKEGKQESKINPSILYKVRVAKGLTQTDISENVNMSLSSYCAVERSKRMVKELMAMVIATALDKKLSDLFLLCIPEKKKYRAKLSIIEEKKSNASKLRSKNTRTGVCRNSASGSKKNNVQRPTKPRGTGSATSRR